VRAVRRRHRGGWAGGPPTEPDEGMAWRSWRNGWRSCSGGCSSCGGFFDLDHRQARLQDLEARQSEAAFWEDSERARTQVQEIKQLKGWVTPFRDLERRLEDAEGLIELLDIEPDAAVSADLVADITHAEADIARLELQTMLQGLDDPRDAILTIHPGAGGTESQDWAEMLMRMYVRWAERKGFTVRVLDLMEGEEAGIKSVTIEIAGEYAYGFLKAEKGVHRLVRISPYDAQKRRHTSFASVFVYPDIDDTIEIDLRDEDIRMDVFRASGAGGQHVNKTSSAVRLTHEPTGLVVSCQQERSQFKNREVAMKMLRAALYQRELDEQNAAKDAVEATKSDNSFGSQIRSYVFQPYTMVNDHRTERKDSDVQTVMDGGIDPFIEAYLKSHGSAAS
jgi:peptide chain release factor 2